MTTYEKDVKRRLRKAGAAAAPVLIAGLTDEIRAMFAPSFGLPYSVDRMSFLGRAVDGKQLRCKDLVA